MIKFFRTIRLKLLSENKPAFFAGRFSQYMLYAIGEIVLVVLGILIAIQINNWYEQKKLNTTELEFLHSFELDLKSDIKEMKRLISFDSTTVEKNKALYQVLNSKNSTFHDSLSSYFFWVNRYGNFHPQKFTYETIKSKGFEMISDQGLRKEIVKLYDYHYVAFKSSIDQRDDYFIETDMFLNRFLSTDDTELLKWPNNYQALIENNEFINVLSSVIAQTKSSLSFYRVLLDRMVKLKSNLNFEIKSKMN